MVATPSRLNSIFYWGAATSQRRRGDVAALTTGLLTVVAALSQLNGRCDVAATVAATSRRARSDVAATVAAQHFFYMGWYGL